MVLLKILVIVLLLVVLPLLLGELVTYRDTSEIVRPIQVRYIMGLFLSLSLFWLLCVPMTLWEESFTLLTVIYSCVLAVLSIIAVWIYCRKRKLKAGLGNVRSMLPRGWEWAYSLMFLILLGIQLYHAAFYDATVWTHDDSDYVVQSMNALSTDHMYMHSTTNGAEMGFVYKRVLNSWPIYIAYLAKVSGFHVTTIAHTVIPVFFLLIAYAVYSYMSERLFEKREDRLIFLAVLSAVFVFGLYSQYSLTLRLLATLWQGKAVLSAIVVPFLFAFLPAVYEQKNSPRTVGYVLLISMTACSLTMMGSGMVLIIYPAMWLVLALCRRRWTGIVYCIAGCVIPAVQMVLYLIRR